MAGKLFRCALPWTIVLGGLFAGSASAQVAIEPPASFSPTDERGVNLASGSFSVQTGTIAIGDPAGGGLSYFASLSTAAIGWRHSVWGGIHKKPTSGTQEPYATYTVTVLGQSNSFTPDEFGGLRLVDGAGVLVKEGGAYRYTAPDGSVALFGQSSFGPVLANQGVITSLTRPNGERLEFAYNDNGSFLNRQVRLQSVSTNLGYQLHFDYVSNTPGSSGWGTVATVTALNLGIDSCAPTAGSCTFSRDWPSLTFADTSVERTVTDTLNRRLRVVLTNGRITGVARPSQTVGANLSVQWSTTNTNRVQSISDGVGQWSYAYSPVPPNQDSYNTTTTVTDLLSNSSVYTFAWNKANWGYTTETVNLTAITDGLGRRTDVIQNGSGLRSITYPEGNRISYPLDSNGNVTGEFRNPKPGSGMSDSATTLTFGDCSTPVRCRRPTSVTDARGGVTDYTYDAAGNLLTETGPAPTPGAPRPQTRYVWEQRYAWYKQNGSSVVTQGPSPVWVRVSQSQCMSGATC